MMYMRTEQAAKFLDVTPQSIYKMIRTGRITDYRKEASCGHPGPPAFEISATELAQIKEERAAKKTKKKDRPGC